MDTKTYALEACRGVTTTRCPHAGKMAPSLQELLHRAVEDSGWLAQAQGKDDLPHHKKLRLAVTACPNGCSRPQVADIGIMLAREPRLVEQDCTGCGLCAQSCPDDAIDMVDGLPVIDRTACMRCGKCADVCPEAAMRIETEGLRVLLGGKLGRHPRFATELPGLYSPGQAATLVRLAIDRVLRSDAEGRFADRLFAQGEERTVDELCRQLRETDRKED